MYPVTTFYGNIAISKRNVQYWEKHLRPITEISGSLSIDVDVTINNLRSIGGDCTTDNDAKADMGNLRMIGGELKINGPTNLDELVTVGGDLSVRWGLKANKLFAIGGNIIIDYGYKFEAENLVYVGGELLIDGKIMNPYEAKINRRMLTHICRNDSAIIYDAILKKYTQVRNESNECGMDMMHF